MSCSFSISEGALVYHCNIHFKLHFLNNGFVLKHIIGTAAAISFEQKHAIANCSRFQFDPVYSQNKHIELMLKHCLCKFEGAELYNNTATKSATLFYSTFTCAIFAGLNISVNSLTFQKLDKTKLGNSATGTPSSCR